MTTTLTRRSIVAAVPAAAVAATLPAIAAGSHPDAALLALREPWQATLAAFEAALSAKGEIDAQIFARSGSYPDYKTWTGSYDGYIEAHRKVTAEREAIEAELGADAANALEDVTSDANTAIVEQIEVIPARTLAGLAFKVEVSEEQGHGREELIDSIMEDVKAMATGGLHA